MARDLRPVLHDIADAAPPDAIEAYDVLERGRRRVRTRRSTVAAAALTLAVAVALAPVVVPPLGGIATGPVAPTQPVGTIAHLSEAVRAVAGRDYTLLLTKRSGDLDRANGIAYGPVADDGLVVAQDGPHGIHDVSRWGLLDPSTAVTDWLPAPEPVGENGSLRVVGIDQTRLVLSNDTFPEGPRMELRVLDRATRRWSSVAIDTAATRSSLGTFGSLRLSGDRVWFTFDRVSPGRPRDSSRLWSAQLVDGSMARDEGVDVGTFDVRNGRLVYLAHDNRPDSTLHVRELATGEDRTFDTRSGRRCNQLDLRLVGENVVLFQYCGEQKGVRDDRLQVVTTTGAPVVTLQGDGLMAGPTGRRFVSVVSTQPDREGTFAWDLDGDRLLRLSDGFSRFGSGGSSNGDRVLWATPILGGHGQQTWIADMR